MIYLLETLDIIKNGDFPVRHVKQPEDTRG